jgi:hypothetical protein
VRARDLAVFRTDPGTHFKRFGDYVIDVKSAPNPYERDLRLAA